MQTTLKILFTLAVFVMISGCEKLESSTEDDEAEIKSRTEEYAQAFNRQDAKKMAELWAKDALYINPVSGETAEGRENIEQYFANRFKNSKAKAIEVVAKSIQFPKPGEAVEEGLVKVSYADKPPEQSAFKIDFIKDGNTWYMDRISEIDLEPAPSNFEHLEELSWLVGNWVDKDENVTIAFNTKWDKYKNFLIQHFQVKVYGEDQLEGQQIIAWDPIKKAVRSWVFDSDGEFGEGTWSKQGNSWYAKMSYTLSDGRRASATNIYSKTDENTYTFSSVGRDVDGDVLPNIDPVKVVKE